MPAVPAVVAKAPVTTLTAAESIVAFVLALLGTHGVFPGLDASTTTQAVVPVVALALPAVFGAAKWALVSPWRKVSAVLEKDGLLTDADAARIEAVVGDVVHSALGTDALAMVVTGDEHPDSDAVGAPDVPTMSAGASA